MNFILSSKSQSILCNSLFSFLSALIYSSTSFPTIHYYRLLFFCPSPCTFWAACLWMKGILTAKFDPFHCFFWTILVFLDQSICRPFYWISPVFLFPQKYCLIDFRTFQKFRYIFFMINLLSGVLKINIYAIFLLLLA